MGEAGTTMRTNDLEALRLQLKERGIQFYKNSGRAREQLLHTLQTNDCREIITAILDGNDLVYSFVVAGARGHVDVLEAFLHHGMNIDIKDNNSWTALMYTSYYEHEECVRFLLTHNANVNTVNKNGETALMIASECGNSKIVQILLEKNANPDLQNSIGKTALMLSSTCGSKVVVQVLLDHNADIELKNNDGQTALDLTDSEEIKEMIQSHVATSYVLK